MSVLHRIVNSVFKVIEPIAIALFGVLFLLVLAQIILRYVFNSPLVWSEELARYLYIWICFFGWLMASRQGDQISIATLLNRLSPRAGRWVRLAIELAAIAFAAILAHQGYEIAMRNLSVSTASLFFPFAVVYAIVPVAGAVAILISLRNIAALIRFEESQSGSDGVSSQ